MVHYHRRNANKYQRDGTLGGDERPNEVRTRFCDDPRFLDYFGRTHNQGGGIMFSLLREGNNCWELVGVHDSLEAAFDAASEINSFMVEMKTVGGSVIIWP